MGKLAQSHTLATHPWGQVYPHSTPTGLTEWAAGSSLWRPGLNAATRMAKRGAMWGRATPKNERPQDPDLQELRGGEKLSGLNC